MRTFINAAHGYLFLLGRWVVLCFRRLTVAERRRCEADIIRDYNKKFHKGSDCV